MDFFETKDEKDADVWVVNTCSIRQKSEDKVYGIGKKVRELRQANPGLKIILAGCMVGSVTGERQRYDFEQLQKRTPWVDYYMNPSQVRELPRILSELGAVDDWVSKALDLFPVTEKRFSTFAPGEDAVANKKHAFVNISLGCDNFCTFCVVPYARGKEISRNKEDIIKEVKLLSKMGYSEITLCGQNVNSWGLDTSVKFQIRSGSDDKIPFAALLREVHEIEGITKISFISSNPFDFTTDLIEALKLPKISRYLHIAVQSGNNDILKKMNRRHTVEEFITLIEKIRKAVPEIEFGTDFIVGFPSETEEQFQDTVKLCEEAKFSVAYISIYSPRKGTPAEKFFKDDVPLKEKKRRHAVLTQVIEKTKQKN
jgi:tRNA-2-methylthio-N6-dimethylallyladenosine synthase